MKRATFLPASRRRVAVALAAPAGAAKLPAISSIPKITLQTPAYEELSFANGMTGFFMEDHEIPVVAITMLVSTSRAPREKTGLGDLAAWAIRNGGSEAWPSDNLNEELEFVAASVEFGGEARGGPMRAIPEAQAGSPGGGRPPPSGWTVSRRTWTSVSTSWGVSSARPPCPRTRSSSDGDDAREHPPRERRARRLAFREFGRIVYGDHPNAWTPTAESVSAITRDDLVAYHRAFFHPNNTIIGISGDVTRDEIVAALDKAFEGWGEPRSPSSLSLLSRRCIGRP